MRVRYLAAVILILGAAILVSAPGNPFTPRDKAYYADEKTLSFVRPGLVFNIVSGEIAADGTMRIRVKMTDPRGAPLDRLGIVTPGPISMSTVVGTIPANSPYWRTYTTRTQTSPITGVAAVQSAADSGGTWQEVAIGEYIYTLNTKAPSNIDRTATHGFYVYGSRNLNEFSLGVNYADKLYQYVPAGGNVTKVRDIIRSATCNKCHTQLAFHGGSRRAMEGCVICHQPQTTDPDTGNTVDMTVMTHKIHMGAALPSVQAGKDYCIIGNQQSVHCYGEVVFSALSPSNCEACHDQSATGANKPVQADAYLRNPSRASCGACHDNVNFATGEGHVGLPQVSDNLCSSCHIPQGEIDFDASIKGAHVYPPFSSLLNGMVVDLVDIADVAPGKAPVVTFTIKDSSGKPLSPSQVNRIAVTWAGPTTDYSMYYQDAATTATGTGDGRYFWRFLRPLPADAKGTFAFEVEGRQVETVLAGTAKQQTIQYGARTVLKFASVDGSKVAERRKSVDLAKCNECHGFLNLHGTNRNTVESCLICHNPTMTDAARRPADKAPAESIQMANMVHKIHMGKGNTEEYTLYGFGNTPHNYNKVGYPGDLASCAECHINDSQSLPLPAGLLTVTDPRSYINPAGPATAACLGCHTSKEAASHALANTSALGESCSVCHGRTSEYSVNKVQAR